jgi:SAM-dependent methyltransferase
MFAGVGSTRRATLARAIRLFRLFRLEQTRPDVFYAALAADSVEQVADFAPVQGVRVLDVGGGPGYFADAFERAGASYVAVDVDVAYDLAGQAAAIRASGTALPLRDASVDIAYSSNVVEHVADPLRLIREMARVTVPGGLVFVSFTVWWSPWGGHETAPWHYLGGRYARRRYRRHRGHEPKNRYGESLFAYGVGDAVRWSRSLDELRVDAVLPRYHPWWAAWVVRVPGLREVVTWNVVLVLRRR